MKKAAALLLLGLFITASFVFLTAVLADTPADPPEFYFTRLLYSEGGVRGGFFRRGRGRGFTMPKPAPFKCPEFGGKNFFPIQGWGWATDYPGGDCKFMGGIHRLTGMHVDPNPNVNEIIQVPNVGNGCDGGPTWERSDDRIPRVYGISDDTGRLMVVVTYNTDLGDAWEYMDAACYPERFSGYAYRMGLNFMIYAMTH